MVNREFKLEREFGRCAVYILATRRYLNEVKNRPDYENAVTWT